jgi:hypothetical protein
MTRLTSTHDLQDTPAPAESRSPYAYLFPDLADAPEAGRFHGTDDAGTLQRLKVFETACHLPPTESPGLTIDLPAAYTYFCQFLNHDISAPVGSVAANLAGLPPVGIIGSADPIGLNKDWRADVATILSHIANEQARPMMLGSLYGEGPSDPESAALYDGAAFRLGLTSVTDDQTFSDSKTPPDQIVHVRGAPDIPRAEGVPLIADRRNDGNLILSQLHLAFMLFHNKAVKALAASTPPDQVFARARALVTLHYHWLILNDVLPAILSPAALTKPLSDWQPRPMPPGAVPMEFTTAAFRFGHSMVGRTYDYNANFGRGSPTGPQGATLGQLFAFTSKGKMGDEAGPHRQLPDHWVIDWDRMTDPAEGDVTGRAERIDLNFAPDMLNVAGNANMLEQGSILFRNLLRGFHRRMPFGQRLAEACGVALLPRDALRSAMPQHASPGDDFPTPTAAAETLGLLDETPAWLYFLCEAQVLEDGRRVGPTASQIIADTIVSLMQGDPASLLRQAVPWHPSQSLLRDADGQPIASLRGFLVFATQGA